MANDSLPASAARCHAWLNTFAAYGNAHLTDLGFAAGAMGAKFRVTVGDPPALRPVPVGRSGKRKVERFASACTTCGRSLMLAWSRCAA